MDYKHEWERDARIEVCRGPVLNSGELDLFEWHVRQTQSLIDRMEADEKEITSKEVDAGDECAGSGGIAVDYFVKRIRYGQVIYLVSLVETFLTRACERLTVAVGEQNIIFRLDELSGDKLTKRRKFLERYGHFSILDKDWNVIGNMVFIRNIVVHENGGVDAGEMPASLSQPGLRIADNELVLDESLISTFSSAVRNLIDHVEREVRQVAARSLQF